MRRIVYGAICVLIVASATTAAMLKFQSQQGPQSQAESAAIAAERAAMEATTAAVQAAQTAQEAEPGKALWLTIRPEGFLPTEITVPAERYFVVIQNLTGLEQFAIRVERENGERLQEVRVERFRRKWKGSIELRPGRYVISEQDHPDWKCVITVTDR